MIDLGPLKVRAKACITDRPDFLGPELVHDLLTVLEDWEKRLNAVRLSEADNIRLKAALEEKQAVINQNHEGALWSEAERRRLSEHVAALRETLEYLLEHPVLGPKRARRVLEETKP